MIILPLRELAYLTTLYTQPHRYYHNINHINFCLGQLELVPKLDSYEEKIVTYAIWYHDAIYNPYSIKNEAASAELFRATHTNSDISVYINNIEDAILETAYHTDDVLEPTSTTALMLDIDLAGLGQDWETFSDNGDMIRLEYSHIDDYTFTHNRLKFFEALARKSHIYYTEFFSHKYEVAAQTNVDNEIKRLYSILN